MNVHLLAALFVLGVWWLSTGLVLAMVWLRESTYRVSLAIFTVLGLAGLAGLFGTSSVDSAEGAYLAFCSALAVWGWHELTFLQGFVTGPRRIGCPDGASQWQRFTYATAAVFYHEVALALTMGAIVAMTWKMPNQVGTSTFAVLWVMRLSSKFNLFLGVRNFTEAFVPSHLRYLLSYFRKARLNPLMPVSLALASAMVVRLVWVALEAQASGFQVVGHTLVATLLALAVVEHVFLAVPVPDALLWRWAIRHKFARDASVAPPEVQTG